MTPSFKNENFIHFEHKVFTFIKSKPKQTLGSCFLIAVCKRFLKHSVANKLIDGGRKFLLTALRKFAVARQQRESLMTSETRVVAERKREI